MLEEKGKAQKLRFGEVLLEYGAITREQLRKALDWQIQVGGRIGSILREMGYLDDDALLGFLSKQFNASPVNLFETKVSPNILNLLPFEKVRSFRVLPIKEAGGNITLAMINPNDINAIQEVEFSLGRRVDPSVVPFYQMEKALHYFEEEGYGNRIFDGEQLKEESTIVETGQPSIYLLLKLLLEHKATELHLTVGVSPSIRIDNEIRRLPLPNVTSEQMVEFALALLTKEQKEVFARERVVDFAVSIPESGRFRMNIYRQRSSISMSAKFVMENIPSLEDLGLPEWISDYTSKTQGLILIVGQSGHGKTTTMAALVDVINTHRRCNIVTIEDPIEYLHRHKKSNVNQREVAVDTDTFASGLKHIFKQNPDVIVIGEMSDPESIEVALKAAETGHLVIGTLYSPNTTTAIDKIINVFPEHKQHQIKMQFADAFLIVFAQRLVPRKSGGRILAYEKLAHSFRVRNLIRESKAFNIRSLMQIASADIIPIDQCLAKLYFTGEITYEDGLKFSDNPAYYQELIKSTV